MALKIKLKNLGERDKKFYRIIVIEEESKRNGKEVKALGYYDPSVKPPRLNYDTKALKEWLEKGATFTEGVRKIIVK